MDAHNGIGTVAATIRLANRLGGRSRCSILDFTCPILLAVAVAMLLILIRDARRSNKALLGDAATRARER